MSDKLFTGFFWFIFASASLMIAGIYWALTVLVPVLLGSIALAVSYINRKNTRRSLTTRPLNELGEGEPKDSDLMSISGSGVRIVATDRYRENWQRIVEELQVDNADTFPIQGTLRAYATGTSESNSISDLSILAFIDYAVVGEVARVEVSTVAPNILALRGAGTCVLNTSLDKNGQVQSIKAYPVPDDQPWWKIW